MNKSSNGNGISTKIKQVNLRDAMVYIAFVILYITFSLTLRDVGLGFSNTGNLMNILRQTSLLAIMSVGMTFVISSGQIDLSVGPVVGVTSVIVAMAINELGVTAGVLIGLGFGAVAGLINGILIAYLKLPPFIATLGMSMVWQGVSRKVSNLKAIIVLDEGFIKIFGGGNAGVFPSVFVWMVVIVIIGYIVIYKTRFGRQVLAVGGNERSAMYSGIRVHRVRIAVMIISGVLAALAGILWTGRFGGGRYSLGEGSETDVIAATVLGGTSMLGGKASLTGAVVGSILIGMLNNALVMYGLDTHQQMIFSGITILLAVIATIRREKLK
ncbi:MAG TPA: ABC transporter permease [Firmicutes bacterium]|nr:ABC transporter permease [Bacillota bacterium]